VLEKIPWRRKKKPFSAWQIELTTRCPLLCKMCIRSERDDWQYQDMPIEDFKKILPYLKEVETVILEGWGESLLHPYLVECVKRVKQEGAEVGFVTSGKGLTRDLASELIHAGLDFVGFSIAGIKEETHAAIRVNSHLSEIREAIHLISEERVRQNRFRPRMHLVFLMVKENILEVPSLPLFAKELGIEEVVLINICHAINAWQEQQRVFIWDAAENPYEHFLKQAGQNARKLHVKLSRPSLSATQVSLCSENPLRNLYISAYGEVSPCVYLYPPLPSPFTRIFCNEEYTLEKLSFGNIFKKPFSAIWRQESYVQFRDRLYERDKKFRDFYFSFLNRSHPLDPHANSLPEPPGFCESCHKMIGV
jgi:MoaA/NifB/PqqE/SkfB family radical SAM enzyme